MESATTQVQPTAVHQHQQQTMSANSALQKVEIGIPADNQVAVACGYMTRAKQSLAHMTLDELEQTLPLPEEKLLPLEDGEEYQYFLQVSLTGLHMLTGIAMLCISCDLPNSSQVLLHCMLSLNSPSCAQSTVAPKICEAHIITALLQHAGVCSIMFVLSRPCPDMKTFPPTIETIWMQLTFDCLHISGSGA